MSLNDTKSGEEIRCYARILDCFNRSGNDPIKKERCKNNSIIKLMGLLKSKGNHILARNSLIMVLSLFNDDVEDPDIFTSLGREITTLTNSSERSKIIQELKKEFLT